MIKSYLKVILVLQAFLICSFGFAQEIGIGQWRDHLPYDYATKVAEFGNDIFCATPYSLFYYDRQDNSINRLSKVNGLSDIGVSSIAYNSDQSTLVVSYSNTNIDLIRSDLSIVNIPDIKRKDILGNKTINSIMNYGKYAYLACGFGIVVLDLERTEIRDTYYIGPEGSSLNVYSIAHNDTSLFAATEDGIYYASLTDPNLAYFANWHKIENIPLPDASYNLVHVFGDKLIVNRLDPNKVEDDLLYDDNGNWRPVDADSTGITYGLRNNGNELIVSYSNHVRVYSSDLQQGLLIYTYGDSGVAPADCIYGSDGNYWIADRHVGLAKVWGGGYEREIIKPSGAPTIDIFDISVENGKLWLVPGGMNGTWGNIWQGARIYSFIDENWTTYSNKNIPALDSLRDMVSVIVDPLDPEKVYAGSWYLGLVELDNGQLAHMFGRYNSSLMISVIQGAPVVKVGGLAFDDQHNLWMTNSASEKLISVKRNDGTWESYSLGSNTVGFNIRQIIADSYGQKWVQVKTGSSNPYFMYVFNENNTDGPKYRGLKSGQGFGDLPGTNVFAMAEDLDGQIWIGTDQGIAVFYSPENILSNQPSDAQRILVDFDGYVQYLLETETVKTIAIDGDNRKWIGTERAGVFLLSADGTQQIYHFTEDNSPLFSNTITKIAIDQESGEVYIATAKGLISYKSTATKGGPVNSDVYAYPNPVRPEYSGPIAVKNLVTNAVVKITDVAGNLVYETKAEGGQAIWNGHDLNGRKANSGVYLVFVSNDDGSEKIVTKILFIN